MAYRLVEGFICVNSLYLCIAYLAMGIKWRLSRQFSLGSGD